MSRKRHTAADEPYFLIRTFAAEYPDGGNLVAHSHDWGQLIFAQAGVMHVWTTQGSWIAPPHWAIWAPAGVDHGMRFSGKTSLRTLYFRPGLTGLPANCGVIRVSPLLRELIHRAIEIGFLDERQPIHAAITQLILDELRSDATPSLDLRMPESALLRRVAEHVSQSPHDRSSNAALAKQFDIGARTLERSFIAETGVALGHWRRQARFLHALRLMGGGAAVKQAAMDSGYQSPSAFIAAFRAVFQTTPGQYFNVTSRTITPRQNRTAPLSA